MHTSKNSAIFWHMFQLLKWPSSGRHYKGYKLKDDVFVKITE
jgi:hypothetical protein